MTWYEAYAFCIWDGGFLPSQTEWEYAAAGGALQREFPWGSTDPGTANQFAIYGDGHVDECFFPGPGLQRCSVSSIAPVGSAPLGAGLWGHLDLVGELAGWTADHADFSGRNGFVSPCVDCAKLTTSSALPLHVPASTTPYRLARGGYFYVTAPGLVVPLASLATDPRQGFDSEGVRCARTP